MVPITWDTFMSSKKHQKFTTDIKHWNIIQINLN